MNQKCMSNNLSKSFYFNFHVAAYLKTCKFILSSFLNKMIRFSSKSDLVAKFSKTLRPDKSSIKVRMVKNKHAIKDGNKIVF